jgi:hypothetical protein
LTRDSYLAMGGVGGALAWHADEVVAGFSAPDARLVRAIFLRLVTPERTRAIVDVAELRELSLEVDRLVGHLVAARLLVVHARGDAEGATAVELVHESLIKSWPKLQRWLDENQEDSSFLAQLRAAAKQWHDKGRPAGLLWRDEAVEEARLWRARHPYRELPPREQDFLAAVLALANRAARRKRNWVVASFAMLLALIAAGGIALWRIREAEQSAIDEAAKAEQARQISEQREKVIEQDRDKLQAERDERDRAQQGEAAAKQQEAEATAQRDAAKKSAELAKRDKQRADLAKQEAIATKAQAAKTAADKARQKQIDDELAKRRSKITNDLK